MKENNSHEELSNPAEHLNGIAFFGHPDDVLADSRLTLPEKRALLASWASDANAMPHLPQLRQLPDGSIVKVEAILRALKALDAPADLRSTAFDRTASFWQQSFDRRRRWRLGWSGRGYRSDDDDDPPPCPAYAARRPKDGGGAAFADYEPAFA